MIRSPQTGRILLYVLVSGTCLAAGWLIGRAARNPDGITQPDSDPPGPPRTVAGERQAAPADRGTFRERAAVLLDSVSRRDLSEVERILRQHPVDPATLELLAQLWLETDPAAFAAVLCANPEADTPSFFSRWAERDFDSALAFLTSRTDYASRCIAAPAIHPEWMKRDPRAALTFLVESGIPGFYTDLDEAPAAGPEEIALVKRLPANSTKAQFVEWATRDLPPLEALKQSIELFEGDRRLVDVRSIIGRMSQEDYPAAQEWLDGVNDPVARRNVVREMATAMVASDPAQALDFADRHLTGRTLSGFLRRAASQLSSSNPEAAEMFRSRLPPAYEVDSGDESQESGEP